MRRKRLKHQATFEERLAEETRKFKEAAENQPLGSTARELLLRRALLAETASRINQWLSPPPPRPTRDEPPMETVKATGRSGTRDRF